MKNQITKKESEIVIADVKTIYDFILGRMNDDSKSKLTIDVYWAAMGLMRFSNGLKEGNGWDQESMDFLTMNGDPISKRR